MLALSGDSVSQPYLVFHDEENDVFIVIAGLANRSGVIRVLVCSRTGGLLLPTILSRASMPTYMPAHVIE